MIPRSPNAKKKPFYTGLSFQVLVGVALAIVFGYLSPAKAEAMKPLGDGFIRLITMIIAFVIFCTVVTGIAGMQDMKKVGRVGGKALLYFEVVSTLPRRSPDTRGKPKRKALAISFCTLFPPPSWMLLPRAIFCRFCWSLSYLASLFPWLARAVSP